MLPLLRPCNSWADHGNRAAIQGARANWFQEVEGVISRWGSNPSRARDFLPLPFLGLYSSKTADKHGRHEEDLKPPNHASAHQRSRSRSEQCMLRQALALNVQLISSTY